jgi:hypothetical protein
MSSPIFEMPTDAGGLAGSTVVALDFAALMRSRSNTALLLLTAPMLMAAPKEAFASHVYSLPAAPAF